MQSQPQKYSLFKSFTHFNLKPLKKALHSIKPSRSINGSMRSESVSTIDFSACLHQNGLDMKEEATIVPVTSMTFSKVVDLYEELEPQLEVSKPARRVRRSSLPKPKINKRRSSRPNTAVDAIIYSRFQLSEFVIPSAERLKPQNSSHLVMAREELSVKARYPQPSILSGREPTAREIRLNYRLYNPPLDCFELRRRSLDQDSLRHPSVTTGYPFLKSKQSQQDVRRGVYSAPYHRQIKDLQSTQALKLETIPESVGGWLVLKDPRDPRQRRTKLDYVFTSW